MAGGPLFDLWFTWHPYDAKSMANLLPGQIFEEGPKEPINTLGIATTAHSTHPKGTFDSMEGDQQQHQQHVASTLMSCYCSFYFSPPSRSGPFSSPAEGNFSLSAHWVHRQHWLPLRNCSFHTCFPLNETITTRFRLISEIYLQRSLPASQYMSEYYILYRVCSWFYDLSRLCVASVTESATDTGKEERVLEWGRVQLVLRGRLDGENVICGAAAGVFLVGCLLPACWHFT